MLSIKVPYAKIEVFIFEFERLFNQFQIAMLKSKRELPRDVRDSKLRKQDSKFKLEF